MLIADHAREGELLLWTPLVECGCPAGFDPEIGAMSPLTVAAGGIAGAKRAGFLRLLALIWAAWRASACCSWPGSIAPRVWVGCAAAIGYMFSAVFTGQAEYTAYLTVMALLPWALWRLEVAIQRNGGCVPRSRPGRSGA